MDRVGCETCGWINTWQAQGRRTADEAERPRNAARFVQACGCAMSTARQKFHIGQRVRINALALERKVSKESRTAIVVGFGNDSNPTGVGIVFEGSNRSGVPLTTRETWHMDFLETVSEPASVQ